MFYPSHIREVSDTQNSCLLQIAIEPKSKADNDKMGAALYKLAQEDPSFHFSRDDETNQTVIEGMGELHLDIIVDRMKREFNVAADIGAPQVQRLLRGGGGGGEYVVHKRNEYNLKMVCPVCELSKG